MLLQLASRQYSGLAAVPHTLRHLSCLTQKVACSNVSNADYGSSSSRYEVGFAAALAAAAAATAGVLPVGPAQADEAADNTDGGSVPDAARRARFMEWLAAHGSNTSGVALQSSLDEGSGLGLFATATLKQHMRHSWLGRRLGAMILHGLDNQTVVAASFPLNLSLTVETALSHPQLGPQFAELLDLGLIDERTAVVLLLMVEAARGDDSPYAPWLQLLPSRFDSPLFYSDQQMQELSGTTLAAATAARKAGLSRSWQQLQPAVQQMLQQVGVLATPSYEDFLWATTIFWSRGLALPVTYTDTQPPAPSSNGSDTSADSRSSVGGSSSGVLRIKVLEGIVPGLDFANHSSQPKCWWQVEQATDSSAQQQQVQDTGDAAPADRHVVKLMTNRVCCPVAGEELTISYGDKGNEELLLLYGFAVPQNPHETLMVLCPLPDPDEWDEVFTARMQLLQAKGLRPQLFLSADHFQTATGGPMLVAPIAPSPEADTTEDALDVSGSSESKTAAVHSRHSSIVPEAARQILEVFVLDKRELAAMLEQEQQQELQQARGLAADAGSSSADPVQEQMQDLGLAMAVLTTFTRLLELKMVAMEGDQGTGSLEADLKQLAADDAAAAAAQQQRQDASSGGGGDGGDSGRLPAWKRHCLLYRAGQKSIVRSYITAARRELQDTLSQLQALMEARGD